MKTKLRSMFVPKDGYIFLAFDLSQAESYIVAWMSEDSNMKKYLLTSDVHAETAFALFHDYNMCVHDWEALGKDKRCRNCSTMIVETKRYIGKQTNHGTGYGMGPERQAQTINKQSDKPPYVTVSIAQCKDYQQKWHGLYPNVRGIYHAETKYKLRNGRSIVTPYGFKRTFYGYLDDHMDKAAYAFIPQSTVCSHFVGAVQRDNPIRGGLRAVRDDLCKGDIKLINMSHDSGLLELPIDLVNEIAPQIIERIKRPMIVKGEEFTIPVDVEVGYSYGTMQPWKVTV